MILPNEDAMLGPALDRRHAEAARIIGALLAETVLLRTRADASYAIGRFEGYREGRDRARNTRAFWLLLGLGVGWTIAALVLLP